MTRAKETFLSLLGAAVVVGGATLGAVKLLEFASSQTASQRVEAKARGPAPVLPPRPASTQKSVPPPSASPQMQEPPSYAPSTARSGLGTIYRCRQAGQTVYSDVPCGGAASTVVDVQPSSGFQPPPRSYQSSAPRPAQRPEVTPTVNPPEASAAAPQAMECAAIDQQIAAIDAEARQPLSIPHQDYLRKQRAALVDQRYALKCHLLQK